ncbi:MAG: hypothetical protein ACRC3B_21675 [Bacteroidia bacterium]
MQIWLAPVAFVLCSCLSSAAAQSDKAVTAMFLSRFSLYTQHSSFFTPEGKSV